MERMERPGGWLVRLAGGAPDVSLTLEVLQPSARPQHVCTDSSQALVRCSSQFAGRRWRGWRGPGAGQPYIGWRRSGRRTAFAGLWTKAACSVPLRRNWEVRSPKRLEARSSKLAVPRGSKLEARSSKVAGPRGSKLEARSTKLEARSPKRLEARSSKLGAQSSQSQEARSSKREARSLHISAEIESVLDTLCGFNNLHVDDI